MSLNKKFRTFMFSNILLGAMAFNNWADDDFSNASLSHFDVSTNSIIYKTGDGEEKVLQNWTVGDLVDKFGVDKVSDFVFAPSNIFSFVHSGDIRGVFSLIDKRCETYDQLKEMLCERDYSHRTVAHELIIRSPEDFLDLIDRKCETYEQLKGILEILYVYNAFFNAAKEVLRREQDKFIGMINRKNFTDVQKQEINKLIGEDVFEVNAQNEENNEPVIDEIPAEKQSQSMFQRVVKFGIKIFEVTKSITGWLLYNLLGVRFWY